MYGDFFQVIDHQAANHAGDQRAEETGAKAVAHPGADGAGGQRGAVRNGVADVGGEKGHHQRQPGDADIKKFLQIRVGGGIGYRAFAIQHDGDRQQDPAGDHEGDHM